MKLFGILIAVLVLLGGGTWAYLSTCTTEECLFFDWQKIPLVDSFERCEELGFAVMESYPRQCRAGDKSFTEIVDQEPIPSEDVVVTNDKIVVASPLANALVTSPLTITGQARGPWYFEASFPVMILDANGEKLGVHYAQAEGDWMTTEFVPFTSTLTFEAPTTDTGTLVLLKDNPSGLPEHEDSISIPVRFK
jgi:hypothetical protein